jgi:predicted AAA+ superfamily ATPase
LPNTFVACKKILSLQAKIVNMEYLNRMADLLLKEHLESSGAVLIEGPKWCGKTTTAMQQAASIIKLQDSDMRENYFSMASIRPSLLLAGDTPRLIDEWQEIPVLWDSVRTMVDERNDVGQFILTGSNTIDKKSIRHTGTGRIATMEMLPMSLFESRESSGTVSLKTLFDDDRLDVDGKLSPMKLEDLIFVACRGGWPAALIRKTHNAQLAVVKDYLNSVCKTDISSIDGISRDEKLTRLILRTYARNISTLAKKSNMLKDVRANVETCSETTFYEYLTALNKLFVIQDVDAWCPAVRSATAVRRGPKREFIDPSIAVAALALSPEMLLQDLKTFGFIFECMCIRDLKAYSQALGGSMFYYHDRYDLEADAVLHLDDGRYALLEFKLGSRDIEEGASHLLEIKRLIREYNEKEKQIRLREPDLLMVVTGGAMAYSRLDGVKVVPLGCLRD